MTPAALERAVAGGRAPALALLAAHADYCRATSVFPSLTPVCLSSIATGSFPDTHEIPHLVWWHRKERRVVEYGSSFAALRAAGMAQSHHRHDLQHEPEAPRPRRRRRSSRPSRTPGSSTAAVNITCYRGRTEASADASVGDEGRLRAEAVLLLQPLRVGPDGRAARGAQPRRRVDRRLRRRCRALARDARRLRLPCVLPVGLRLRLPCAWARRRRGCRAGTHRRRHPGAARRRRWSRGDSSSVMP